MAKAAGGTTIGIPMAEITAVLNMSHNGTQRWSPICPTTVQVRQGQHQKP